MIFIFSGNNSTIYNHAYINVCQIKKCSSPFQSRFSLFNQYYRIYNLFIILPTLFINLILVLSVILFLIII